MYLSLLTFIIINKINIKLRTLIIFSHPLNINDKDYNIDERLNQPRYEINITKLQD